MGFNPLRMALGMCLNLAKASFPHVYDDASNTCLAVEAEMS